MGNSFLAELSGKDGFESGTPATLDSISNAEKDLKLEFSQEYKEYLTKYGSASYRGHFLTGISPFQGVDVVAVTSEAREYYSQLPKNCYVIEEAHIDGIIICQNSDGAVFRIAPESEMVKICDSLAEYIEL